VRWRIPLSAALIAASSITALAACGASHNGTQGESHPTVVALQLSSAAFRDGSSIPRRYTCDGTDIAPPLTWARVPARARSLALLAEDQNAPGGAFVHWSVYDLPRGASGVGSGRLPSGSAEGLNSFGRVGYAGPCPPKGDPPHHYVFSIHALDDYPGLSPGASPATVREAISGHALASGTLTGLYQR
jgi:Raf kinase inhibitor-like YbhB/YbcL family protein